MVQLAATVALAASLAASALASPVQPQIKTIPVTRSSDKSSLPANQIVQLDQERIAARAAKHGSANVVKPVSDANSATITNADVSYLASLTVGGQTFSKLIVDTGSSNTWVGASTKFSGSARSTGNSVSVSYGSGSFSGTEYVGSVSFAGLTVSSQSFGSASKSSGFTGVDGIFGVGPVDLTQGTVSNTNTVPTFLDNLRSQGSIGTEALGVYFHPESGSDTNDANGELTLGGADSSKYTGSLNYYTVSGTSPYSYYWGLNTAGLTYGSTSLSGSAPSIVDTGTTLIYIPTSAYNKFLSATGGQTDQNSGLAQFSSKPTGTFTIKVGSNSYPLTPTQYLVPTAQYSYFGLQSGYYYAWINDGGSTTADVNFIIGQKFLENYYSVFDTTNNRIGFATRA